MARLNGDLPYYDLKSIWPLNYYLFDGYQLDGFLQNGSLGTALLIFGILSTLIITPILTYKFGKRWYCSWVCGCGGLAETAGDPFRQLSDKSLRAWKLERWMIHLILVWVFISTVGVVYSYLLQTPDSYFIGPNTFLISVGLLFSLVVGLILWKRSDWLAKDARSSVIAISSIVVLLLGFFFFSESDRVLFIPSYQIRSAYGFFIGSIFSGVIGTGFYPILGNRVWCRFGCPMAAILGIQQKLFSKFKISTNGGQCISCGNCSAYCEMGIDVRSYAQRQEPIKRASCVGCGICSEVCPRGVLRLES
jgi:polyferredoxin